MQIKEVTSWLDREMFVRFPEKIYKNDDQACLSLFAEQRKFISKRHPFRRHADAAMFLVLENRIPVARALVSFDPLQANLEKKNIAHIGLFESVDSQRASAAVLSACETWAKARHHVAELRGPIDYSLNYPIGMYLGPYNAPQRILMNYNPDYYPKFWEDFGFKKAHDLFSWWGESPDKLDMWAEKIRRLGSHSSVKIESLNKENFAAEIAKLESFFPIILDAHSGYVPMTKSEFAQFKKSLIFVPPELIMVAKDGPEIVGLALTLPDFNEIIRPLNGRLNPYFLPTGSIKFWRNLKNIKAARVGLLGVHPERRFEGIAERLIIETLDIGRKKFNFQSAEMGLDLRR